MERLVVLAASLAALSVVACRRQVPRHPSASQQVDNDAESPKGANDETSQLSREWAALALPLRARVTESTRLEAVTPAAFEITLHAGAKLEVTGVSDGMASVRVSNYSIAEGLPVWDSEYGWDDDVDPYTQAKVLGVIPLEALTQIDNQEQENRPRAEMAPRCSSIGAEKVTGTVALNHRRLLVADPQNIKSALVTNGGDIEILEERTFDGHVFQKVRQLTENVELQGWTPIPIKYSWGTHECMRRKVYLPPPELNRLASGELRRHAARFAVFGEQLENAQLRPGKELFEPGGDAEWELALEAFAAPVVPESFVGVDPLTIREVVSDFRRTSTLYGVVLVGEVPVCATHRVKDGKLAIEATADTQSGKIEKTSEYTVYFSPLGAMSLDGPTVAWTNNGQASRSVSFGCTSSFRIVGSDSESFHIMGGGYPIFAYQPDDATRWYKSKSTCEDALAQHPRSLLKGKQMRIAQTKMSLLGGC